LVPAIVRLQGILRTDYFSGEEKANGPGRGNETAHLTVDSASDALNRSRKHGSKGKVNDGNVKDATLVSHFVFISRSTPAILHRCDASLMHRGVSMKPITLRSVPPRVAKAIRREAARKGQSINKTVISLLEGRPTVKEKKQGRKILHRELDSLAGSWSKKEAAEFDKTLAAQRTIDPDLWK
jgi:hypothetical protein